MGVLNVTPDSFSDGGKFITPNAALQHVERMINNGADIIDIGAESTRPGAEIVPVDKERKRIEAAGIRDAQLIIKEGISQGNIEWKSLEVLREIATSNNAKLILTDGKTPVLINTDK